VSGPAAPREDLTAEDRAATGDLSRGLEELAGLISFRVGAWHDFGYEDPPSPDCKPVPPLGERSAEAIRNGHQAVRDIDELIRQLHGLRGQLVSELRQDEDLRAAGDPQGYCTVCGGNAGHFIGYEGPRHFRGEGTAASPVEITDPGHEPAVAWRYPDGDR
jgi:hypothetical protein